MNLFSVYFLLPLSILIIPLVKCQQNSEEENANQLVNKSFELFSFDTSIYEKILFSSRQVDL